MIVNDFPEQMLPLFTEMAGTAFTVTLDTAVLDETQPCALVPVTEYAVVEEGVTVKVPPVTV
jgi:hypothetical protein